MRSLLISCALAVGLGASALPAHADGVRIFVRHEVADYAMWRKIYDGFETTQRKMGVTAESVYQSTDDPNDITVVHDFASEDKAQAFLASDALKSAMQNAGVKGKPQTWTTKAASKATGKPGAVRMFVQHEVADYARWRQVYDQFQKTAASMGVVSEAVYQVTNNPDNVVAYHDFSSVEKAKAFASSAELKAAMKSAGVKTQPLIWFTTRQAK
jgi:quinol monooxygenase YgiN